MALEANWEAKTEAKFLLVRSRENWASKPTFPSDIQRACACMAMWARMWLCFVLFFGSLVGVVAIPLLPGRPHDRAPFFGDLFCGHGKCR